MSPCRRPDKGGTSLSDPVLSCEISVDYPAKPGVLKRASLQIDRGEILGLVGQSGSGKSTLALAIPRLLEHTGARVSGRTLLLGRDLMLCREPELRNIRGRQLALVPQSPVSALNLALRIGTHFSEAWRAHSSEPWSSRKKYLAELLSTAGLSDGEAILNRYPSQISVGQAQRVLIVMALLHSPPVLIADEPTSALDALTQREIVDLLCRLRTERGLSMLFISHDLVTVSSLCDRIAILYGGEIVECGPAAEVIAAPAHPYTRLLTGTLLRSRPRAGAELAADLRPDR